MSNEPEYFKLEIKWNNNKSAEFPFFAVINQQTLVIRINDFPEEEMYTLVVDDNELCDFTIWPSNWKKPGK
jgi:hypothetical protein